MLLFHLSGDQEAIGNFVTQALEGTVKYPSRSEYNKRKQYQDLADKFFTVEEFLELYDDPLKHFSDETRNVDAVCFHYGHSIPNFYSFNLFHVFIAISRGSFQSAEIRF